jgi:hypothetical protein
MVFPNLAKYKNPLGRYFTIQIPWCTARGRCSTCRGLVLRVTFGNRYIMFARGLLRCHLCSSSCSLQCPHFMLCHNSKSLILQMWDFIPTKCRSLHRTTVVAKLTNSNILLTLGFILCICGHFLGCVCDFYSWGKK